MQKQNEKSEKEFSEESRKVGNKIEKEKVNSDEGGNAAGEREHSDNECHSDKCGCSHHDDKACEELKARCKSLEEEKKSLESKLAKEKDDYIRLLAEFQTFRNRTNEQKKEIESTASADTIKGLLPVLDDCEKAMDMLRGSADEAAKEGTGLIYSKLLKYLKSKGLEPIEAKGKKFDTEFHEAVAQVPVSDKDKKGHVFDVVETGYTYGGKILRYAKVVVGI